MLTNGDNHNGSEPINEKLNYIQKEIIYEIRKTQNIMIFQMCALLLFALFNGGFFIPYITYEVIGNALIPRIFIAFFFFIAVVRSAIKFTPYMRKGYKILRDIETTKSDGNFKSGIALYVSEFYQLSKHRKNRYSKEKNGSVVERVPKVFLWELLAFVIMGVLLIGYDIVLLGWYPTHTPSGVNIALFCMTVVLYLVLVVLTLILKNRSDKWLEGFQEITKWGKRIEKTPVKSMDGE